jgi:hypothetical protein
MPRPQFTLKTMLWLTALVGVGCVVGPPVWSKLFPHPPRSVEEYARERQRLYEQRVGH